MSGWLDIYRGLYVWDLGEQRTVLIGIRADAVRAGDEALVAMVDQAIDLNQKALDMQLTWEVVQSLPPSGRDTIAVDRNVDRQLKVVCTTLAAVAGSALHPHRDAARALLEAAFPRGLRAHSQAPFVEQQYLNTGGVNTLRDPKFAAVIEALALGPDIDRLAELTALFSDLVNGRPAVTADAVRSAADLSADAAFTVVCRVIGDHWPADPARVARREALLTEVRATEARMRVRYAAIGHRREAKPACVTPAPAAGAAPVPPVPPVTAVPPAPAETPTVTDEAAK